MIRAFDFTAITRTFRHRNFRIYFFGGAASNIGTWMQRVGVGWLTWELTESGTWLGLVVAAELFPTMLLSLFPGAAADRFDRLTMFRMAQACAGLQAVALALLTLSGLITVELLLGLTFALGIALSISQPSRMALLPGSGTV